MNKDLLDYIRHLSKQDRKSLSEKVLKAGEEFGELAKVALPYTQAYATNHRFIKREQILEESVDLILCSLSVAYDLDFTDAEIEEMINLKCKKWQGLQAAEQDIVYPLPYEIHITVKAGDNQFFESNFKKVCEELNMTPVFIDNQFKSGKTERDVMTSYTHYGNNTSAYETLCSLSAELRTRYYNIVREKIETVPWHPAAPRTTEQTMPKDCYFEAHIGISYIPTVDNKILLEMDIQDYNFQRTPDHRLHMSSNPYKINEDGTVITYVTLRLHDGTLDEFERQVKDAIDTLNYYRNWNTHKVHKEFAIYDTNVSHDAAWLKGE